MPRPGDIHHCNECGPKGARKRARKRGLCKHKKSCWGTLALPHNEFFMGNDEDCIICEMAQDAADRRQREQRERDEKAAKKRGDIASKQMNGRKKPKTTR